MTPTPKKAKNQGMVSGRFWALLRRPDALPVLFSSKQDAVENLDYDEYLVEVRVHPASAMALLRGRRELLRRKDAEAAAKRRVRLAGASDRETSRRPRIPAEQKRRRGSLKIVGVGTLRAELEKMAPKMRQRFAEAIDKETRAFAGIDLAKGRDRSAELEVKRGRDGKLKFRPRVSDTRKRRRGR